MFSWRAGRKITLDHDNIIQERKIICICYKWEGSKKIGWLAWNNGDDEEMILEFADVANSADELVAHNGAKFDVRWFNGRNLMLDLPPIPDYKIVDTLSIARKKFFLNSYRLDYLGKILLNEGKIKTDFGLWKDIVLRNDPKALKKMVQYCKKDVELLERVYHKLAPYDNPKTHVGIMNGKDRWTCPQCGSSEVKKTKTRPTAKGMVRHQMQCNSCHRYFQIANNVFQKYLVAKYGEEVGRNNQAA